MSAPAPLPASSQAAWKPLLPADLREQAFAALHAIAHDLPSAQDPAPGPGLAGGHAGFALFHAYYSQAKLDGHDHSHLALAHMETAVDGLAELGGYPGFYGGYPGVAWAVDHLQSIGALDPEEDLNEVIDDAVLEQLAVRPQKTLCEIIGGVGGFGLYGLGRAARPKGRRIVEEAVDALDSMAIREDGRVTWFSPPEALHELARKANPNGCFNLGLSHGVPGAIGFLAEAAALGVDRALPLVEGAVRWLLEQARPCANGSQFGYTVEPKDSHSHGTRLAWCYGDLGIAAMLLLVARRLDRADWAEAAIEIGRGAAARPIEGAGVVDAALCHGSIGNAHIFHRLWQATGDPAFEEATLRWLKDGLAMRRPGAGSGGFLAWRSPQEGSTTATYEPEYALLEGSAGIGLALLAFLTPQEPAWDSFLLINIPPRA